MSLTYEDYLITERLPVFWCPGCGNGNTLGAIVRSFAELQLERNKTVAVTGIGCWGKADDYIRTNSFHGTHGRAIAFATGIKLANPELTVLALMGDGDGSTIGGNHLIHAARRNVDITAIVVNNLNYGMTGGQYSGTTPQDYITSTSPYGHVEKGFDLCKLVAAAGAPYVARSTVYNIVQLQKFITEGIKKRGFSLIEVISPCPTHFGRRNDMRTAPQMLRWIKDNTLTIAQAEKLSDEELENKYVVGKFVDREQEDYSTKYEKVREIAQQKA
jgi:2-oxoglutarate ferredoxin oxidoreductase subunit beta